MHNVTRFVTAALTAAVLTLLAAMPLVAAWRTPPEQPALPTPIPWAGRCYGRWNRASVTRGRPTWPRRGPKSIACCPTSCATPPRAPSACKACGPLRLKRPFERHGICRVFRRKRISIGFLIDAGLRPLGAAVLRDHRGALLRHWVLKQLRFSGFPALCPCRRPPSRRV